MVTKKTETTPVDTNTNLLVALILKVGGHSLTDSEIERAKTHTLTVATDESGQTVLGAIPA